MKTLTDDQPTIAECETATANKDFRIGSGRHRIGYHIPGSRWVYKVQRNATGSTNREEYDRYREITESNKMPYGVFLPEMHLLSNGVIASEFIPGDKPTYCDWEEHEDYHTDDNSCWLTIVQLFESIFDLDDSSASCNVRVVESDGTRKVYMIDLGE